MIKPRTVPLLAITLLAVSMLMLNPEASAQVSLGSPTSSAMSAVTKVPDFYAGGSSGSYSLRVSAQGGYLANGPYTTPLMPWGYVTAKWTIGTVYIIFLANVTETDFTIAFLYLTNSTNPFLLRIYRYSDDSLNLLNFDGTQHVYERTITTSSVPMLPLKIKAQPKILSNVLCAIGPDIYLDRNYGKIMNTSASLTIYPLRNQYFTDPSDYNELWSLLTDDAGHYYFGILYMRNNDPTHVILEHQLRLNDYQAISGRTFDATWSRGFEGSLTVRLPVSNATVIVDGFPFQTNERGIASMHVPTGPIVVQIPDEIDPATGGRLRFTSWTKFGNANPFYLTLNSSLNLIANYAVEYPLTVQSAFGETQGGGWYVDGTNATFSVPAQVNLNNGTRRVFSHWDGNFNSTSSEGWVLMNSPKNVQAYWVTQFKVTFQLQGTPPNSTVAVLTNGQPLQVQAPASQEIWIDQNSMLTIQVQTTQLQDAAVSYNYTGMLVNDAPSDANVVVVKPLNIALTYSAHPKTQSSIDLSVNPTSAVEGYPLTIVGSVAPQGGTANVRLFYSTDNINWDRMAETAVGPDGRFTYTWTASNTGTYFIKAFWPGDDEHTAATRVVSVKVMQAPFSNLGGSNQFSDILQGLMSKVRSVPVLATVFELVSSLILLGFVLGAAIAPSSSPLVGYFIGSLMVGFVLIFPISTLILTIKVVRSHRAPSLLWLTPLATIWLAALGLVMTGTFMVSPPLSEAAGFLLVSSNALMLPLTVSLLVAKGVVA